MRKHIRGKRAIFRHVSKSTDFTDHAAQQGKTVLAGRGFCIRKRLNALQKVADQKVDQIVAAIKVLIETSARNIRLMDDPVDGHLRHRNACQFLIDR